ncbi:MAG: TIGR03621 family F420-dependent LLM class oxidoreductase [Actinomycetota bacterium]
MTRPFRFAVQLSEAGSRDDWIDKVTRAEALGYDVVAMPDHVSYQLAPMPALVAAAEATERVRLATFVLDNDFRNPVLMAQEAETVNLLTGGRLELGLGAGWWGQDYERLGIEFAAPRVRLERLQEAVEIVDRYFTGEPFSFEGRHYRVAGVDPPARVKELARPTLILAGGGPKILDFAARRADVVGVFLKSRRDGSGFVDDDYTAEACERKTQRVREVASEASRDVELNILLQHCEVTNDRKSVAEERAREDGISGDDLLGLPFELIGTVDQMVGDLLERRERYGISYITVFDRYHGTFAPLIERLR